MKAVFHELTSAEEKNAKRLNSLDRRMRALAINKLLAQARVAVSRVALVALMAKTEKAPKSPETGKATSRRVKLLQRRLERAARRRAIFERASRVILIRRLRMQMRLMEGR